jgi:predicted DNA-binding transcriptional regulator YafY
VGIPPRQYTDGPVRTALIRFDPDIAWMIAENVQPDQEFTPEPEGYGVLEVNYREPSALIRWVAHYGPSAEILEPEGLREMMRDHFRRVIERCES